MNCSPLRGIRSEPLTVSPVRPPLLFAESALTTSHSGSPMLDTSLDDEFAAQQQQQLGSPEQERKYDDAATPATTTAAPQQQTLIPTLAELAAESIPSDNEEEEAPRTPFSLPTPTPFVAHASATASTPSFSSPLTSAHVTPSFEVHQQSNSASTLVTPPNRVYYNRFATPVANASSSTPASQRQQQQPPLTDYKGTPIDRTMRRNLISADAAASVSPDAFRSAAAASLSVTAPRSLLNTLASPSKSAHLRGLEAQMARARLHSSNRAAPLAAELEHDSTLEPEPEASLLSEEQSSVEIAEDAVEEMGTAASAAHDDGGDENGFSDEDEDATPRGALLFTPMAPPASAASTPFLSPLASATPRAEPASASAAKGRIIRESTPLSLAPRARVSQPSAPLPAPDSQRWSVPVELSKLAEQHQRSTASRYNQKAAAKEEARKAHLLHSATSALNAAVPLPLPKISPPTPEQWQLERAAQPAKGKQQQQPQQQAKSMAAGLAAIKSKVALQRRNAAAAIATGAHAAQAAKTAPASAPTARSRPTSARPSTGAAAPARVPLATLALNYDAGGNPWLNAADRAAQAAEAEQQKQQQADFATPLKRVSATVSHTPALAENASSAEPQQFREPPAVFHLPAPLSPPAQPAQSYRALVNGVHILPPALSWIASHHTTEPERIHANLRFITTAYAHAD